MRRLFSSNKRTPAQEAAAQRDTSGESRRAAAALRAVGANKLADSARRSAATSNVVARYVESGRCQLGHRDCTSQDH